MLAHGHGFHECPNHEPRPRFLLLVIFLCNNDEVKAASSGFSLAVVPLDFPTI